MDWDAVENGTWAAKPPIKPKVEKPGDVSNYEVRSGHTDNEGLVTWSHC